MQQMQPPLQHCSSAALLLSVPMACMTQHIFYEGAQPSCLSVAAVNSAAVMHPEALLAR